MTIKIFDNKKMHMTEKRHTKYLLRPVGGFTMKSGFSASRKKLSTGFTLMELMVVVGIFAFLSAVLLANYSKFSSSIILENVAYSTALSIREAQTYGMIVKEFSPGSNEFPAYGVYFYTGGNGNKEFYQFADTSGSNDKMYNGGASCTPGSGECFDKLVLQNSYSIYAICNNLKKDNVAGTFRTIADVENTNNIGDYCKTSSDTANMSISFTRPNPDASVKFDDDGDITTADDAEIIIASPRGDVRMIVVWGTGQISVE